MSTALVQGTPGVSFFFVEIQARREQLERRRGDTKRGLKHHNEQSLWSRKMAPVGRSSQKMKVKDREGQQCGRV